MKSGTVARTVVLLVALIWLPYFEAAPITLDHLHALSAPDASTKRSSSAIAITADGSTLLVVNPDSNSLSLVDLGTLLSVTEISVGADQIGRERV